MNLIVSSCNLRDGRYAAVSFGSNDRSFKQITSTCDITLGMMAPSPSKSSKTQHPSFLITADSVDTSPVPSSPPSTDAPKSQCSSLSDGESFECYGDNDISISEAGGVDLELAPHLNSTIVGHNDNLPNRRWGSMRQLTGGKDSSDTGLGSQIWQA
uniref:Uncharacterized protein n=1 Tax=Anopheles culicifacies TaxID=139723 RepID=A0A182MAM3_9DIPT